MHIFRQCGGECIFFTSAEESANFSPVPRISTVSHQCGGECTVSHQRVGKCTFSPWCGGECKFFHQCGGECTLHRFSLVQKREHIFHQCGGECTFFTSAEESAHFSPVRRRVISKGYKYPEGANTAQGEAVSTRMLLPSQPLPPPPPPPPHPSPPIQLSPFFQLLVC